MLRRIVQALIVTGLLAAILVPYVLEKTNFVPNQFDLSFQTELDGYDVSVQVDRERGQRRSLDDGQASTRFFDTDVTALRLILDKHPALRRNVFSRARLQETEQISNGGNAHLYWSGRVPALNQLSYLAFRFRDAVDVGSLELTVNGSPAPFSHQMDDLFFFRSDSGYHIVETMHLVGDSLLRCPVEAMYVFEREPQSVYIRELSFFRNIRRLDFIHEIRRYGTQQFLEAFNVVSGAKFRGLHPALPFAEFLPYDTKIVFEYSGDMASFHASIEERGRAIRLLVLGALFLGLGVVFVLATRYLPEIDCSIVHRARSAIGACGAAVADIWSLGASLRVRQDVRRFLNMRLHLATLTRLPWVLREFGSRLREAYSQTSVLQHLTVKGITLVFVVIMAAIVVLFRAEPYRPAFLLGAFAIGLAVPIAMADGDSTHTPKRDPRGWSGIAGWILLLLIAALMVIMQLYRLGEAHLWLDEAYSFLPARLILETGEPVFPGTGFRYFRAYTYHRIVAQFMAWFGVSYFAARLPNLFFNVGTLLVIFLFGKRHSVLTGLIAAFVWMSTSYVLQISRWVRFYPMFWFLFALSAYLFYLAVIEMPRPKVNWRVGNLDLSFNPVYLIAFFPVFLLAMETQPLTVVLPMGFFVFFTVEAFFTHSKPRAVVAALVMLAILLIGAMHRQGTINLYEAYVLRAAPSHELQTPPDFRIVTTPMRESIVLWFLIPVVFPLTLCARERLTRFVAAIAVTGIAFIGIHYAQAPRYWSMLVPFITLAGAIVFVELARKKTYVAVFLSFLALATSIDQSPALSSSMQNRNLMFGVDELDRALDYSDLFLNNETQLIADRHMVYSLEAAGIRYLGSIQGHPRLDHYRIAVTDLPRYLEPGIVLVFYRDYPEIVVHTSDGFRHSGFAKLHLVRIIGLTDTPRDSQSLDEMVHQLSTTSTS